ncbi:MAG: hypothetical protein Fues2KO_49940 [Fuerstiella sp.]
MVELKLGSFDPWPTGQVDTSPMPADTVSLTLPDAETGGAFRYRLVVPLDAKTPGAFRYLLPGLTTLSFPALSGSCPIEADVRPGLSATG